MAAILVKLFEHNRWANLRAVEACAALTDAQLDATLPGVSAGTSAAGSHHQWVGAAQPGAEAADGNRAHLPEP